LHPLKRYGFHGIVVVGFAGAIRVVVVAFLMRMMAVAIVGMIVQSGHTLGSQLRRHGGKPCRDGNILTRIFQLWYTAPGSLARRTVKTAGVAAGVVWIGTGRHCFCGCSR